MTQPIRDPSTQRRLNNHGWRVNQLERRPSILPIGFADHNIEYFWGGPKLNWFINPPGDSIADSFSQWTRDLTVDFGGYLSNGTGSDGNEMFIGAPLGPRWSTWELDICTGMGPDYGILSVEVATVPIYHLCEGVGSLDPPPSSLSMYDIPSPSNRGGSSDYSPWVWHDPGAGWTRDEYDGAGESFNHYQEEVGFSFKLAGEYGDLLTNVDTGECDSVSNQTFDSGDGVMYFFRIYVNGKNASSTGFKARIQAVRLARVIELDGLLI